MESSLKLKVVRFIRDGLLFNYKKPRFLNPIINEDLFWSYVVPGMYRWFKVPTPDISKGFAFDVNPRYLFEQNGGTLPMAIHAWWRYDPDFVQDLITTNMSEQTTL